VHDSSESLFSLFGTYHCITFTLDNSKNPYPGLLVFNECESNSENLDLKKTTRKQQKWKLKVETDSVAKGS